MKKSHLVVLVLLCLATVILLGFGVYYIYNYLSRVNEKMQNTDISVSRLAQIQEDYIGQSKSEQPNFDPLVSPDKKWLVDVRRTGNVHTGKYLFYLELTGLQGQPNRLVYFDWSGQTSPPNAHYIPVGWSNDGEFVYTLYTWSPDIGYDTYNDLLQPVLPLSAAISIVNAKTGRIRRLLSDELEYTKSWSRIFDINTQNEKILWYKLEHDGGSGMLALTDINGMNVVPIANMENVSSTITSAILGHNAEVIAYVVQSQDNDKLFLHAVETHKTVEVPLEETYKLLEKEGLKEYNHIMLIKSNIGLSSASKIVWFTNGIDKKWMQVEIPQNLFEDNTK